MQDLVTVAIGLLAGHPAVTGVALAGSRSRGTHEELSDWDFAVETSDFDAVAHDLPTLVAPLDPLGQQWEPIGHFPVFQVLLRGPTKVEYLFLEHSQEPSPPVEPSGDTLVAINTHFWDWIWWLATKASVGRDDLVGRHLSQLQAYLLQPIGVTTMPTSIDAAIDLFVARRDALEHEYGVSVPRALEEEVRRGISRIGYKIAVATTPPLCPSCGQPASAALGGPEHDWECRNEACPEYGQALRAHEPSSEDEPGPGPPHDADR